MLDRDGNRGIPVKGNPARHHLVHGNSQRINIALGIGNTAPHLLRGAVMNRSHDICRNRIGIHCLGNAKIRKLYLSVGGYHNILRLDIPVNNSPVMSRLQTERNLNGNAGSFLDA